MSGIFGNVFILGDSYSTFEGEIPEGYNVYYMKHGDSVHTTVSCVEKTWWHSLLTGTGSGLVRNDSWSGSTVCKTGYGGNYCDNSAFVTRIEKHLVNGKCQGKPVDTVFVFGGTNDSWALSPIGNYKYSDWTDDDLKCFLPAYCRVISYIVNENPGVRVISIINDGLREEISRGIREISEKYGTEYVQLQGISKQNGHPDETGMKQIKEQILKNCGVKSER